MPVSKDPQPLRRGVGIQINPDVSPRKVVCGPGDLWGKQAALKAIALHRADIDARMPALMAHLLDAQLHMLREIEQRVQTIEAELAIVQRESQSARQLRAVPGISLLGATALAATLGDGSGWRNGREFACALGLTPHHEGTGGKVRIGAISKRGDPYLRTLLVSGARAMLSQANPTPWIAQMLARRPANVVAVALGHKLARTAWALVAHGRSYDTQSHSVPPQRQTAQAMATP
ncbi:Transposase IS116/IS110/IS902 family protein [Variovorax sp. RA8]|nr:Transposase IS116/IS110/IS902 family protein [Variovorax sp. RA8]